MSSSSSLLHVWDVSIEIGVAIASIWIVYGYFARRRARAYAANQRSIPVPPPPPSPPRSTSNHHDDDDDEDDEDDENEDAVVVPSITTTADILAITSSHTSGDKFQAFMREPLCEDLATVPGIGAASDSATRIALRRRGKSIITTFQLVGQFYKCNRNTDTFRKWLLELDDTAFKSLADTVTRAIAQKVAIMSGDWAIEAAVQADAENDKQ